jgi:hypothetical protein
MARYSEHNDKPSSFIKSGNFLTSQVNFSWSRRPLCCEGILMFLNQGMPVSVNKECQFE